MPLNVKETGTNFTPVPQGTHGAVCFLVADIGLQVGIYGTKHKVVLGFELPNLMIDIEGEPKPMIIYSTYTASLSDKAILRKDMEGWRGKQFTKEELEGFDLFNILGKSCILTVVHNVQSDRTYANITGIGKLMAGMDDFKATRLLKYSKDEPGQLDSLPEWIQNKIKHVSPQESIQQMKNVIDHPEQQVTQSAGQVKADADIYDDDIPF